ncbi:MAG: RHS repeat-associated core domain-containing protein [Acidimicrobiales bacterium]
MLSNSHFLRSLSLSVSAVLLFVCVARGQILNVTDTTSTPIAGAGHDYIKMLNETVNPANGSLSIRIQTPVPPGRRLTMPFAFAYDSNGVHHPESVANSQILWLSNTSFISKGGWAYSVPMLSAAFENRSYTVPAGGGPTYSCSYYTDFAFQDPSGGRHALGLASITNDYTSGAPAGSSGCAYFSITTVAYGGDPYLLAVSGTAEVYPVTYGGPPYLISDPDGTLYHFPTLPLEAGPSPTYQELPDFVEDRNGNKATFTDSGGGAFTETDTLGRTAISSSGFGASGNTVTIAGLSQPYTVTWGSTSYNYSVGSSYVPGSGTGCNLVPGLSGSLPVISSITLPNNTSYHFYYDSTYGLLNKIVYPNGGYVRYVWGLNAQSESGFFPDVYGNPQSCWEYFGTPVVLHRYVSFNGSTEVLQQDFTYSTAWNITSWTSKHTSVTTKDLARGLSATTTYVYWPFDAPLVPDEPGVAAGQIPVENTVSYGDWSGTTLRTVDKTWLDQYRLACQQTILGSSSPSSMELLYYYAGGAEVTERDEYDFGTTCPSLVNGSNPSPAPTASLLRQTKIAYAAFGDTPLFPGGAPISDRPSSVISYDGSGDRLAETDYTYDGGSLAPSGVQTGHDSSYSTSMDVRGNATSKSEWVNTSGGSLTWDYTYDDTGQQVSMTDPKGNPPTEYSYADDFTACGSPPGTTNAYLTKIMDAKGFTQSFTYRYCDGQLNSATDRNGQPTSYSYADSLNRLTQVSYPDTGQTTYTYSAACGQPSTTILLGGSSDYTESATMDGVCHVTRNTITSDPAGDDYTDTTYDGSGRVWKVSNPYRSTSDPTYGLTTTTYDALGRITQVAYPDGSVATTSYTGNTWTVKDAAAKTRKLQSDALGRLASVTETSITPNYSTSYSYNALDDLLTVSQGGQTRTFSYDSLSRVTSATYPESGLTSYTYPTSSGSGICSGDPSSPCTRTDARGVTTTYAYNDPLNRPTSKTYSDGSTPTANFFYDETTVTLGSWTSPGLNYPNGRLTHTTTMSGSTLQTATVQDYDKMGRTQDYWQCTPYNCGASSIFHGYYHYDLAGDNDWWIHPAGFTITNTISPARQITQMQSSWVDSNHPQYLAQSISYSPWGAVNALQTGCAGSGCANAQETYQYNKRLQPAVIELGTTTQDYCLVYNYSGSSPTSCQLPSQGTTNNGNVVGYWYQDNVNPSFSHTASYTYDGVNRLTHAVATPFGSGSVSYNLTFSYTQDGSNGQYGNMSCVTNAQTVGLCTNLSFNAANNHITTSGYTYDAAGNQTKDSSNLSAHTYQWDAEGRVALVDGGSTWNFTYNALGDRVQWAYSGGADQHLFDPAGTWLGNAGSYSLVTFGGRYFALYLGGNTLFNHVNALDSASMRTLQSGAEAEDILFYPWGDVWAVQGSGGYNFANIPYRDVTTSTDITTARFSSPNFGRWLSADPIGVKAVKLEDPQTWNMYAYVRNNPTTLTDPTGLLDTAPPALTCSDEKPGCVNGLDPSAVSPNKVGPGNPPATQNNNNQQPQQNPQQPKNGAGVLVTGTGAIDLGVGKAGVTAQGSVSPVGGFIDNKGHPHVGAEASGSLGAYAGQDIAATPKQDKDSFVFGAFAGVGAGVTLTNAGNAPAMKSMTNTLNIDLGIGPAASMSISAGHSGTWSFTITLGWGYGAAVTETNTGTATLPSQ